MTFLTNLGVTEILYSFRLVLEGKAGKEAPLISRHIKIRVLRKVLANIFTLSDAEDNIYRPLNRGVIVYLFFLRTLLAIP